MADGYLRKIHPVPGAGVDAQLHQACTQRTAVAWIACLQAVQTLHHSRLHDSITQAIEPVRKRLAAARVLENAKLDGRAPHECSL